MVTQKRQGFPLAKHRAEN